MKLLPTLLAMLTAMKIGTARHFPDFTVSEKCRDAPDVDWTKSINAYLRRIPDKINFATFVGHYPLPEIELGEVTLRGLGGFRVYKPLTTFCVANNTFLEVFVFTANSPSIAVEWMACSGHYGELGTQVSGSGLRLLFLARPSAEQPYNLQLRKVYPDSAGDAKLFITGGSQIFHTLANVGSIIAGPYLQILWNNFFLQEAALLIEEQQEHWRRSFYY